MSDIQSISQGNYILHNIDAKKLYVQEPLFTANSGDAVYVGWRPDETVLWENSDSWNLPGCTLSENFSNFEKLKIYSSIVGSAAVVNEVSIVDGSTCDLLLPAGNNQPVFRLIQFSGSGNALSATRSVGIFFNSFAGTPTYRYSNAEDLKIFNKVVGVNRISG